MIKSESGSRLDFILILLVSLLTGIGILAVYSATYGSTESSGAYFSRQLIFAFTGLSVMLITAFLPFRFLQRTAYPFYGFAIFLLILVEFIGIRGFGAERWLSFGPVKLQPSELAKLATVLAVARFISSDKTDVNRFRDLAIVFGLILLPFLLIAQQPDLGTSLIFLALVVPVLFWAGLNWFALFVLLSPFATAILSFNYYAFLIWMLIISAVLFLSRKRMYILITVFILHILVGLVTPRFWDQLRPYQKQRILTFANPEADPQGAGYQIIQSKVAIGSGGIWGKGFLQGSQTQLKFLPAQHTDFIFSVIGEEWGFAGVGIVLLVFMMLILYLLYLAGMVRSTFSSIAITGITTIVFFHIFINIGMTVGLAPVTGLPLPFISYGGSFLMVILLMMGYVLNFARNRYLQ